MTPRGLGHFTPRVAGIRLALPPMRHDLTDDSEFQRAFAAVAYFAGTRDAALLAPFATPSSELRAFCASLSAPEQSARAEALSTELERIARRIEARRLGP